MNERELEEAIWMLDRALERDDVKLTQKSRRQQIREAKDEEVYSLLLSRLAESD